MSQQTKIEWTDATWNPIRGCTKVSPGCRHCYAERFAERFKGIEGHPFGQGFDLRLVPGKIAEPLHWLKPRMVFVNSISDLFHASVPEGYIDSVARVMLAARWHTCQVLTKRSSRMQKLLSGALREVAHSKHIWWGVSVEDKKHGLPRIAHLQATPVSFRFLSVEPLLEDLGTIPLDGISWVIVGGESGPGARPMREEWVLSVKEQCRKASVPFFFKQWGGVRKKAAGRTLRGRTYDSIPAREVHPVLQLEERNRCAAEIISTAAKCARRNEVIDQKVANQQHCHPDDAGLR